MSGSLRHAWEFLAADVWEPLADYAGDDGDAPPDLFSDLFALADDYLGLRPTEAQLEEARNDPARARSLFLTLRGTDFASESAAVQFVEDARTVIDDYEVPGLSSEYRRRVRDALRKFNLRYRLDEPFTLRFMLPGTFTNLYGELQRVNSGSTHLVGLLTDFEKSFDRYARTQDATDLKTCIAKASNYLEGLASATRGVPSTLGRLCDQLTDWPHDKVRDGVKNLYKFCSDYPGVRHAATRMASGVTWPCAT